MLSGYQNSGRYANWNMVTSKTNQRPHTETFAAKGTTTGSGSHRRGKPVRKGSDVSPQQDQAPCPDSHTSNTHASPSTARVECIAHAAQ